jgi:hypothetical protein
MRAGQERLRVSAPAKKRSSASALVLVLSLASPAFGQMNSLGCPTTHPCRFSPTSTATIPFAAGSIFQPNNYYCTNSGSIAASINTGTATISCTNGLTPLCGICYANGAACLGSEECASGYCSAQGQCGVAPPKSDNPLWEGSACTSDGQCLSGRCRNGYCCFSSSDQLCRSCTVGNGMCNGCLPGYTLQNDGTCGTIPGYTQAQCSLLINQNVNPDIYGPNSYLKSADCVANYFGLPNPNAIFETASLTLDNVGMDKWRFCLAAGSNCAVTGTSLSVNGSLCVGGTTTLTTQAASDAVNNIVLPSGTSRVCAILKCDNTDQACPTRSYSLTLSGSGYTACGSAFKLIPAAASSSSVGGLPPAPTCGLPCPAAFPYLVSSTPKTTLAFADPVSRVVDTSYFSCEGSTTGGKLSVTSNAADFSIDCGATGYICGKGSFAPGISCAAGWQCSTGMCVGGMCSTVSGTGLKVVGAKCSVGNTECVGGTACRKAPTGDGPGTYGRCCSANVTALNPQCSTCNDKGLCLGCNVGYDLINPTPSDPSKVQCLATPGITCSLDAECKSGVCRSGRCCGTIASANCSSCDAIGNCLGCKNGLPMYGSGDTATCAKRPGGFACSLQDECASGMCRRDAYEGMFCCKVGGGYGCSQCDGGTGSCSACAYDYKLSTALGICNSATPGAKCAANSDCASGACKGGICCMAGMNDNCEACQTYVWTGTASVQGGCGACKAGYKLSSTGGCNPLPSPAPIVNPGQPLPVDLPEAVATLSYRSMVSPSATGTGARRQLAATALDTCVITCFQGGVSVKVNGTKFYLQPVLPTRWTNAGLPCYCDTITAEATSTMTPNLATATFTQPDTSTVAVAIRLDAQGYIVVTMAPPTTFTSISNIYSFSYFLLACSVKSLALTLADTLCKATVSLEPASSNPGSLSLPTDVASAIGPSVVACYKACLAGGFHAVVAGTSSGTVVLTPRDPNPATGCDCPAVTGKYMSSTLIQGTITPFEFSLVAGSMDPRLSVKLNTKEVGAYQYHVSSCLGPTGFCVPYASSTSATTGKRSSTYLGDSLLTSVDSCNRACLTGGYQISISGTAATLTPISLKPYVGCTCKSMYGTLNGGNIYGTAPPSTTSPVSFGFTVTSPANDQVAIQLTQSSNNAAVGTVSFASSGCVKSTTSFCGDTAPVTPPTTSPNVGAIVGGIFAAVAVIAAVVFVLYRYRKWPFDGYNDENYEPEEEQVENQYRGNSIRMSFKRVKTLGMRSLRRLGLPSQRVLHDNPMARAGTGGLQTPGSQRGSMYSSPQPIRSGSTRAFMTAAPKPVGTPAGYGRPSGYGGITASV